MAYELSSRRVNQDKYQKYFQAHKALAHSNGCKLLPSRKSGRNHTLEEQPRVRIVPSVTQTHCTSDGHLLGHYHEVSASQPKVILQKLDRSWEPKKNFGFLLRRAKLRTSCCPAGVSCTGEDVVLCIYVKKQYHFCPHRYRIIDIGTQIPDEVPGIIHIFGVWTPCKNPLAGHYSSPLWLVKS